jgi:hypothetical protein
MKSSPKSLLEKLVRAPIWHGPTIFRGGNILFSSRSNDITARDDNGIPPVDNFIESCSFFFFFFFFFFFLKFQPDYVPYPLREMAMQKWTITEVEKICGVDIDMLIPCSLIWTPNVA